MCVWGPPRACCLLGQVLAIVGTERPWGCCSPKLDLGAAFHRIQLAESGPVSLLAGCVQSEQPASSRLSLTLCGHQAGPTTPSAHWGSGRSNQLAVLPSGVLSVQVSRGSWGSVRGGVCPLQPPWQLCLAWPCAAFPVSPRSHVVWGGASVRVAGHSLCGGHRASHVLWATGHAGQTNQSILQAAGETQGTPAGLTCVSARSPERV